MIGLIPSQIRCFRLNPPRSDWQKVGFVFLSNGIVFLMSTIMEETSILLSRHEAYSVLEANHVRWTYPVVDISVSWWPSLEMFFIFIFFVELCNFREERVWHPSFFKSHLSIIVLTSRLTQIHFNSRMFGSITWGLRVCFITSLHGALIAFVEHAVLVLDFSMDRESNIHTIVGLLDFAALRCCHRDKNTKEHAKRRWSKLISVCHNCKVRWTSSKSSKSSTIRGLWIRHTIRSKLKSTQTSYEQQPPKVDFWSLFLWCFYWRLSPNRVLEERRN